VLLFHGKIKDEKMTDEFVNSKAPYYFNFFENGVAKNLIISSLAHKKSPKPDQETEVEIR